MKRPTSIDRLTWAKHIKQNYTRPYINEELSVEPLVCNTCLGYTHSGYFDKVGNFMCGVCYTRVITPQMVMVQLDLFDDKQGW